MSTISANSSAHAPVSMFRSVSTESSGSTIAVNPSTARLQRLPTPPRSPGLAPLGRQLTLIEPPMTKGIRFLILDCPTDSTLPFYMQELKRNNVTDVVRCCEPTYRAETLRAEGITVHDWPFRDGAVEKWASGQTRTSNFYDNQAIRRHLPRKRHDHKEHRMDRIEQPTRN